MRHGFYTPEERHIALSMRAAGASFAEIGARLERPKEGVKRALQRLANKKARKNAVASPPPPKLRRKPEDELVRQVLADGGFPRVEIIGGRAAWVYPVRRAA